MTETKTNAANVCRICDTALDSAMPIESGTHPCEGAFSMCFYCGDVTVFRADLTLREATLSERRELARNLKLQGFRVLIVPKSVLGS